MQTREPKEGYKLVKSLFGRYEQIPLDWEIKTFEGVFEFLRTGINPRDELKESGDINYIHYGDIHAKWNSILDCDREKLPYIDSEKVKDLPLLKDGDLIIADASEDYEGSGASVLLRNVKDRKIVSGLHTIALRSVDENVNPNFKTYLTSINFVKRQIIAYVTGISVYGLSKNNLKKVRIPLPPLDEQRKIASILSKVDDLIHKTDEIIEQTRKFSKGLMQKLLTTGIGHTKFKKAILFPKYLSTTIPEEWELTSLSSVTSKIADRDHRTPVYLQKGIPMISPTNIDDDMNLDSKDLKYVSEEEQERNYKKTDIRPRDIIFSRIGAGLGKSFIVKDEFYKFSILHSLCQIRGNELIVPEFLLWFLRGELIQKRMWVTVQSMGVPDLGLEAIGQLPIFLPATDEQQKIALVMSNVESMIKRGKDYRSGLETLKRVLMHKLLTGQIRVK